MRSFLVSVFLVFFHVHLSAQKELELPKKFWGEYKGVIPEYVLPSSGGEVRVNETPIEVKINASDIELKVGQLQRKGQYNVLFESKGYFLIESKPEGQLVGERIMVFKRGKKISRDGTYPQPSAILFKQKTR